MVDGKHKCAGSRAMLGMSPTLLSHKWRPDTSTKRVKNNETVTMGSTALLCMAVIKAAESQI